MESAQVPAFKILALPGLKEWQGLLLTTETLPLVEKARAPLQKLCGEITRLFTIDLNMRHHLLFQTWNLSSLSGANIISGNVKDWQLQVGNGIWPHRNQTDGWTEEMMVNAAAAVFKGEEPELPMTKLLLVGANNSEKLRAASLMRGFGVQIQLFSELGIKTVASKATAEFSSRLRSAGAPEPIFLIPLLDCAGVLAANSDDQLSTWLCGAEIYMRESVEDKGVLIVARTAVTELVINRILAIHQSI